MWYGAYSKLFIRQCGETSEWYRIYGILFAVRLYISGEFFIYDGYYLFLFLL